MKIRRVYCKTSCGEEKPAIWYQEQNQLCREEKWAIMHYPDQHELVNETSVMTGVIYRR